MAKRAKGAVDAPSEPVEGPRRLPEGWQWRRLGDVLPLQYGKALKASDRASDGPFAVYGSAGITGSHDEPLFQGPGLIVGRKGSAGAVYFSKEPAFAIDTAYYCTSTTAHMDLRLGYHLLTHQNLRKLDQSTAVPSLSRDTYNDVVVPVPPDSMQPMLAAKIDELFTELDDADAILRKVREFSPASARASDLAATLRQSILAAAFRGDLIQ